MKEFTRKEMDAVVMRGMYLTEQNKKLIVKNKELTEQLRLHGVIERLEKLQKWYLQAGCGWNQGVLETDKDDDGDWVRIEDIGELIKKLKENVL